MLSLLNPRTWLYMVMAVLLAASMGLSYRAGRAAVRIQWDADIAARTAQALEAEKSARAREQALTRRNADVDAKYQAAKKQSVASAAALSDALRMLNDAIADTGKTPDPATTSRANGGAGPVEHLLGECAARYSQMGQVADLLETRIVGLQSYIKQVCLAP